MSAIFKFKQFSVDQSGCAMKINTDGVLLGTVVTANSPENILDIGTGTGVIALMLAQKFSNAKIDAVEIDASAAKTAAQNFDNSPFSKRLNLFPVSINDFFDEHQGNMYELIVSNPPFYMNSLESPEEKKSLAKHTDASFFERLMKDISCHLSSKGACWLILPFQAVPLAEALANQNGLYLQKAIAIHSFEHSKPHRQILCLGFEKLVAENPRLNIYKSVGVYSDEYKNLLKPYFLAF
ncbi:tRNA1Val (adenine37-N6)-methyltransferase [Mucilaginibacter frigoritolerans]|uniref:tRNA1(Val) (adenine(37)-N6)-methyltransferase n=1 Tax=Mucilaginibacter frigoritolerans TaxID=652788 RepID=A0A562TV39_9SPHI|nr:methyltransferase [Mucilaginibacter frigoritolerans]TWI96660.1 tRNA1Val (adenine37-N6)-methyltransferase [Mucilaginibacter frigoritolerans]